MNRELRTLLFREFLERTRVAVRFFGVAVMAFATVGLPLFLFAGITALGAPWFLVIPVFVLYVPIGAAWTVWLDYNDGKLR